MKTIKNILRNLLLHSFFLFLTCGVFAQTEFPKIKAGKVYKQSGVIVTSPNEPNWQIAKAEKEETVFYKTSGGKEFKAFVKTVKIPVYQTVQDFYMNMEKSKTEEISKLNRDSLHFYNTEFKETPCLQYDGSFPEPKPNFRYFNMNGYLCRHPLDKSVVIQIEFSDYSNAKGYTEPEFKLSKSFFEKVIFSKIK